MKSFKEFKEESEAPLNRAEIAKRRFSDQRAKSKEIKKRQLDNKKKGINTFNTQKTKLNTIGLPKEKPKTVTVKHKHEIVDKTKKKEKE